MRTLIPEPVEASARPRGRAGWSARYGRWLGYGLTTRGLLLASAGVLFLLPAFFGLHHVWPMLGWDGLLLALAGFEVAVLPAPGAIRVTRTFLGSPRLGRATEVELRCVQASDRVLFLTLTDDLAAALTPVPLVAEVVAYPRDAVTARLSFLPARRGDVALGNVYLRYTTGLQLVERWAVVEAAQMARVFPANEEGDHPELHLMRARQIELEKRRLRQRGTGREFDSLRDYQAGDELRSVSWPATARRARLITRQFTTERSQQVWIMIDAGRLSRTAFELRRRAPLPQGASEQDHEETLALAVTQLDQATTAAVMLAETVSASGDRFGLLTYGRGIQQQLVPGAGAGHLRLLLDQLSQVRAETAEANHLQAAARLRQLQRRRGLVVWITELADSVGRPEVVAAVIGLVRRHLVLLVLLEHPELEALAAGEVANVGDMYAAAAAREMLDRRRETIAGLRRQGVLVVETSPATVGLKTINSYLDVKARGLL